MRGPHIAPRENLIDGEIRCGGWGDTWRTASKPITRGQNAYRYLLAGLGRKDRKTKSDECIQPEMLIFSRGGWLFDDLNHCDISY